jgi:uncharacterized membrane protein YdbT with pleckstrin-like domain
MTHTDDIILRPAFLFAVLKTMPLILLAITLLLLAWWLSPYFILFSFVVSVAVWYRIIYIRKVEYLVTTEYIRISQGIFFKRIDQLEMYRIKDYVMIQPLFLQLFRMMDLLLKSTDPENPMIWLRGIPESEIIDTIRDRVQEARKHNNIYEVN